MAHPNEELIRRGYEAFGAGDMATLNELFSDDVVWHAPGHNQIAGIFHGKEEVFGTFQKVAELTGGTFKIDIHTVLADDEHVAVLARAMGEHEGRTWTTTASRSSTSGTARSPSNGCIPVTPMHRISSGVDRNEG